MTSAELSMHVTEMHTPITLRPLSDYEPPLGQPAILRRDNPHRRLHAVVERPAKKSVKPETIDPAIQLAVRRLLTAVVEVLDGRRSVSQLRSQFGEKAYASLETRARGVKRSMRPSKLRIGRLCQPTPKAIEISATIDNGHRVRAMAARVDFADTTLCCNVLRLL